MLNKIFALLLASIIIAGCSFASQEKLYTGDITGDSLDETMVTTKSDVTATDDVLAVYPHVFSELTVKSDTTDGEKEILRIDGEGLTVETGDKVFAGIETQAAYAAQLVLGDQNTFDRLTIVQLNASGEPVSEPLTIRWNVDTIQWVLQ